MKKLILSVAAFTFATGLFAQRAAADVLKFDTETINQGNLKVNDPKEVRFVVTNISKEPLIIAQANPTCGCTVGDYTKSPIAPGSTGYVSAKFNAAGVGHFNKTLTVKFEGVDEIKNITITGDVLSAEDYDKWAAENEAKKKAEAPVVAPAKTTTKIKTKTKGSSN